ncbi:MAG: deoxynucleoside kinase, partial [Nitrospinota bacterium]
MNMNEPLKESTYIAIEGAIGVGKSSLCNKLAEHFSARQILEEAEENPFLKSFYKKMEKYSFQTQLFFLLSRYKQQQEIKQPNLFHQHTISDYLFDRDRIFAYLTLSEDEIRLYEEVYSLLKPRIPKPDLLIYLQADLGIIKKRIETRD